MQLFKLSVMVLSTGIAFSLGCAAMFVGLIAGWWWLFVWGVISYIAVMQLAFAPEWWCAPDKPTGMLPAHTGKTCVLTDDERREVLDVLWAACLDEEWGRERTKRFSEIWDKLKPRKNV